MPQKSFIGSQKGWMMPLIAILTVVVLLFRGKAKADPVPAIILNNVSGVPSELMEAAALDFGDSNYQNLYNWLAVSKMETAGWSSGLWRNAMNPWGMTFPSSRPTRAAGIYANATALDFARYDDLDDASADIILYMDATGFPKGKLTLYDHVVQMGKRGYFGTEAVDAYYKKVTSWLAR